MKANKNEKVEKILEKVKKLLALAGNNPSEEEAKSASLKAQKLLNEYNLTLSEVEKDERLEITEDSFDCGGDNQWKFGLSQVIARNFCCEHYWINKKKVVFYGYEADCKIAREVFGFLFTTCKKRMTQVADKAYNETGTSRGVRYSFTRGFVDGVKEVLDAQSTALMIIVPPEVSEDFAKNVSFETKSIRRKDQAYFNKAHYDMGVNEGKSSMKARAIEN